MFGEGAPKPLKADGEVAPENETALAAAIARARLRALIEKCTTLEERKG